MAPTESGNVSELPEAVGEEQLGDRQAAVVRADVQDRPGVGLGRCLQCAWRCMTPFGRPVVPEL